LSRETRSIREVVWWVVADIRWRLAAAAITGFAGGLTEALFLVVMTRTAFAITDGQSEIGLFAGYSMSVNGALVVAVLLLVLRFALAVSTARQQAAVSFVVIRAQRRRLASAFLDASWEVQQGSSDFMV
jgi:ATP-binding cassette subfamily B protein